MYIFYYISQGRACSMMGLIFGCILTFFGFFKQCLCPLPLGNKLIDISGVLVQISLALTWPMIRSSVCDTYGCSWGGGATALLCSQLFFFAASVFTRCMRPPRYERRQAKVAAEKSLQESLLPPGSDRDEFIYGSQGSHA